MQKSFFGVDEEMMEVWVWMATVRGGWSYISSGSGRSGGGGGASFSTPWTRTR